MLALDWRNGNVKELRARYERACRLPLSDRDRWSTIQYSGRELRLLIHEPPAESAGDCTIVYFHGGGWIVGSPETHADISRALCDSTGLRVVSVAYRLAPEHKAPGASRTPYSIAALAAPARSPMYLMVAGRDPLRDDSLTLARALRLQGAPLTVDLHGREGHGFLQDGRAPTRVASSLAGLAMWVREVVLRGRR